MQTAIYKRPALGQCFYLGSLYNARTDNFLPEYLLTVILDGSVKVTDISRAETTFGDDDTYQEKFDKMALCPELMATVLAGSGNIQGSGGYLNEQRHSFPTVHRAMHYSLQTVEEKLHLFGNNVNDYIDENQLRHPEATHIVTEIIWGANCIVSATRRLLPDEDRNAAQVSLKKAFEIFKNDEANAAPMPRRFRGQFRASSENVDQLFEMGLYSDFPLGSHPRIQDLAEAKEHIVNLPDYIRDANDGKGMQVTYSLLPIGFLSIMFGIPPTVTVAQLSPECLTRLVALVDNISEAERSLNEYYSCLDRHRFCIPSAHLIEVGNQIRYVGQGKTDLLREYSRLLKPVREGTTGSQDIWQLLENFDKGDSSPKNLLSLVDTTKEKMEFVDIAMSHGAEYIGYNEDTVDDLLRNQLYNTVYILYFNAQSMGSKEEWDGNCKLFFTLLRKGKCSAAIVDCDATGKQIAGSSIAHYEDGNLLTEDVGEQEKELATKSFIQYDDRYLQRTEDLPAQRRAVVIACPGLQCDPMVKHNWVCRFCRCPVEYGTLDKYFYCVCGRVRFDKTMFKCCNPGHGSDMYSYAGTELYSCLESMPPPNELNILILGETGVGKSTFINAFINYLTYDTLDEALKIPNLNWIIPCSFAIQLPDQTTNSFIQRKILVGNDADEHGGVKGQSATQKATAYSIYVQDQLVRLIDTPGMGDTRGPEQDRKNMSDVLSVLRSYDNIHGIIILLKPNNPRLNFMFRFVIQELLGQLHRSAARNMVYAFTNTRGSNFTPGDSYVPLENLLLEFKNVLPRLSQSNVYCFDSESFRYLAAKKVVGLELGDIQDYRRSWSKSSQESQRLRNHFQTLQPHPVKNTVSLNATRYLIENLIAPMRQVSKTILGSIAQSEQQKLDLEKTNATGEDLKAKLKISKIVLKTHISEKPITACNHVECIKKVDREGEKVKIHKSLCHNPCCLTDVKPYITGAQGLDNCYAFRNNHGKCQRCNHRWQDHEHTLVTYTEITEISDDPEVVNALMRTNNETKAKAAALKALDGQIAEFKEEHLKIQEAAARFTVYMQENSITVYNDAALEYLRHLIKEENVKVQLGGDSTRLEALKKECEQYQAYVETIKDARKRGVPGALLDEQGVSRLVKELYSMKHYGKDLQRIANVVGRAYAATFRETAYHIRPKQYWMRARGHSSHGSHASHGGQGGHVPGRPYSSLLDLDSSSVHMPPPRRRDSTQRSSQQSETPPDDNSWQASYAELAPQNPHSDQQPSYRGLLPFDDENRSQPSQPNDFSSRSEKSGSSFSPSYTNSHSDRSSTSGGKRGWLTQSLLKKKRPGSSARAESETEKPPSGIYGREKPMPLPQLEEEPPPYEAPSQSQTNGAGYSNGSGPGGIMVRGKPYRLSFVGTLKKKLGK